MDWIKKNPDRFILALSAVILIAVGALLFLSAQGFREKFAEIRAAGDAERKEIEQARAEALRILSADPFDDVAYERQISRIGELRAEMFAKSGQMMKQTAKELTPEERRMLADVLRRPGPAPKQR